MSYRPAPEPFTIAGRLVARLEEFTHVRDAWIAWVFSPVELRVRGQRAAAFIAMPTVSGPMRDYFEWTLQAVALPQCPDGLDFVVFVDEGLYESYPTDDHRERLVYHELCHVEQKVNQWGTPLFDESGRARLKLRGHDTEVFDAEVARYGEAICGLTSHVAALKASRKKRGRRRHAA